MILQYRLSVIKLILIVLIVTIICENVQAKIHKHHHNALLKKLGHHHHHHRRADDGGTDALPADASTDPPPADASTDAPPADASTEGNELEVEGHLAEAKIENDLDTKACCETEPPVEMKEYTHPSMPPHIDKHYFEVTPTVPYYTVGVVGPIGYDPPLEKLSSCERLYRKHLRDQLYSEPDTETEESMEIVRLPNGKDDRERIIAEMFQFREPDRVNEIINPKGQKKKKCEQDD